MHTQSLPALRRLRGLSFRQSLMAAFLVIAALLGGAAVQALLTLEHVAKQSRAVSHNAVRLTESAQRLAE
jgi:two-component system, NtrC family, sensor histidine kinase GlrK